MLRRLFYERVAMAEHGVKQMGPPLLALSGDPGAGADVELRLGNSAPWIALNKFDETEVRLRRRGAARTV